MKTIYLKIAKWTMFLVASAATGYLMKAWTIAHYSVLFRNDIIFLIPALVCLAFWAAWVALLIYLHRRGEAKPSENFGGKIAKTALYTILHILIFVVVAGLFVLNLGIPPAYTG
jgi:hypothetical protein